MTTTTDPALAGRPTAQAVLRRLFEEGFGGGGDSVVDELFAPTLTEHQFGLAGSGVEAIRNVKAAIRNVHEIVPDMSCTIEDSAEVGDAIWTRVRARGTATGPFFGPPSGRPIDITVIDVCRVVDGRIVEHWGVPDRFALLAQTGALDRLAP